MRALEKNNISMHCILASLYFLMLPLTISVNSAGASLLKIATIPISVYFLISLLFYKKDFHVNIIHILLGVFTVATVFTMFVNPTSDNLEYITGYFLNAAFFICISVVEYNERELKILEYVQILLLIIITAITFYNDATVHGRATLSVFGQTSDPNYYVGFFIFPMTVTMKKICTGRYRLLYVALAALSVYAIFLSGSRGGLLAILATIVSFAVIYPQKKTDKLFILVGMLLSVLVLWIAVKPFLSDTVVERMSIEAVVETGGTHRIDIWRSMLGEIKNSPSNFIFGRGIGVLHSMMVEGKEVTVMAHNHMIQALYDQGIIGVLAFVMIVSGCFFRCIGKRKCVSVALIGMLVLSLSLSFSPSVKSFWNILPYAAFAFPDVQKCGSEDSTSDTSDV